MALNAVAVGTFDKWVTIEQLTETASTSGFPVETWTTLQTAWMAGEDVQGTERMTPAQLSAVGTRRWTTRYVSTLDPEVVDVAKTRRLRYRGRTYDITRITMIGRRQGLRIQTLAKVG